MKYCICTLALGSEYIKIANMLLESYVKNVPPNGPKIIVVTNDVSSLLKDERIIPVSVKDEVWDVFVEKYPAVKMPEDIGKRRRTGENYFISMKWLAFEEAFALGYNNICFVDADTLALESWDENLFDSVAEQGLGCNWLRTYGEDVSSWEHRRGPATRKLATLLTEGDKFPMLCPIECIMFLRESKDKVGKFILEWKNLWKKMVKKNLYHKQVCHEIGLAATRAGVKVYRYSGGNRACLKNFEHYSVRHLKRMRSDMEDMR